MPEQSEDVVRAIHEDGIRHDAGRADRLGRRRNLHPDEAALLSVVCEAMGVARVLEIGTSNGYSTLWLARAVSATGGTVLSVDVDVDAQRAAAATLSRAGLLEHVHLRGADGGKVLRELPDSGQDVVCLDSERSQYAGWWPHPLRVLRAGGLLAMDNVLSHPDQVAEVRALIEADPRLSSTVVPVGQGLLLAVVRR